VDVTGHGGAGWRFDIGQTFQELEVKALADGRDLTVRGKRLLGTEIKMVITGVVGGRPWNHLFKGTIDGDRISGEVAVSDGENIRTLPWTAVRQK